MAIGSIAVVRLGFDAGSSDGIDTYSKQKKRKGREREGGTVVAVFSTYPTYNTLSNFFFENREILCMGSWRW